MDDDIPYLLLTPGPLTTSRKVRQSMLADHCTWDDDYNRIVTSIRHQIEELAGGGDITSMLMQGSGTFSVESTLGSVVPQAGKVLAIDNGAYGRRIIQICQRLGIDVVEITLPETEPVTAAQIEQHLSDDSNISHVAVVHCETTTGLLNPIEAIGEVVRKQGRCFIVDAMSSFGGIPMSMESTGADFLVSSANKCIQGVPGFGFVIARRAALAATEGRARSLSLDLYDQWHEMEENGGKWRFTSPTHTVRAFATALDELAEEGGVASRFERYSQNHSQLIEGMTSLGFRPLIDAAYRSPIITSFIYPEDPRFEFMDFYQRLKARRYVIYPGKVSRAKTFRIGTIGHVFPSDIKELIAAVSEVIGEMKIKL